MNLIVQAGTVTGDVLQSWLRVSTENSLQTWLKQQGEQNIHALLEYVHRFAFVDWVDCLQDLERAEIAEFCLQGRVFWETGQIAWKRLAPFQHSLCLVLEDVSSPPLPTGFVAEQFPETVTYYEDSCLVLWGTYNKEEQIFLEQRVAGSRPLIYPKAITSIAKTYPILEIRTYFNEEGNPSLWRFLRPSARDLDDWPKIAEEEN